MRYLICHIVAFILSFVMDILLGDPVFKYHPIRLIGNLIGKIEKKTNSGASSIKIFFKGLLMALFVPFISAFSMLLILYFAYRLNLICGILTEGAAGFFCISQKSLKDESLKVFYSLKKNDIVKARYDLSMIVGRDTERLGKEDIVKAAVETVAENTSDGVIAPMLYLAAGGPVLGFFYKAVNTLDSMVGYHSKRYEYFGKASARFDDVMNFLPSRLSAVFMIAASSFLQLIYGREYMDSIRAVKIFLRDRYNHKSINSAQTESVCAGALGIRLGGDAYYFGEPVKKPYIGDDIYIPSMEDIKKSHRLLLGSSFICFIFCILTLFTVNFLC